MKIISKLLVVLAIAILPASAFAAPANPMLTSLVDGIDEGEEGPQLVLSELDVSISQHGNLAEFTLEAQITNPSDDEVEARFTMQLPPSAVVTGYALDIGGVMIPGSLVDQPKARQIYEDEVRGNIDPGLAEISSSNEFSTRIYPVAAEGTRRISLSFVTPIDAAEGLSLPLATAGPVSVFRLNADLTGVSGTPMITLGGESLPLTRERRGWRIVDYVESEATLSGAIGISGAEPRNSATATIHSGGRRFFTISDSVTASSLVDNPPSRVRVYWDSSRSRRDALVETERDLLGQFMALVAPEAVDVVRFASAEPEVRKFAGDDRTALGAYLSDTTYRGATSFAALDGLDLEEADLCLVFTDGGVSLDHTASFSPDCPLLIVSSGNRIDGARIGRISNETGAMSMVLTEDNSASVLEQMQRMPVGVVSIRDDGGNRLKFRTLTTSEGQALVIGELGDWNTLTVRYSGTRIGDRRKVYVVDSSRAAEHDAAGVLWAAQEVARLSEDPSDREQMQSIAQEFQVASPTMAFLVLEEPRQYVDADLVPPEGFDVDWMENYAKLREQRDDRRKNEREERLEFVVSEWNDVRNWWDRKFDQDTAMDNRRRSEGVTEAEVGDQPATTGGETLSLPPPPPALAVPSPPAEAAELAVEQSRRSDNFSGGASDFGDDSYIVVTGTRMASNIQEVPIAVTVLTGEEFTTSGAGEQQVQVELADVLGDRPYLTALNDADPDVRLTVLAEQENSFGTLPAFYLDVAEWFRLKGEEGIARDLLLSALDLAASDDETTLIVAFRLEREGDYDTAVALLERLAVAIDYRTQPKRTLALALIARGQSRGGEAGRADFERAFELLREVVLEPTDNRYSGIETVALMELNALIPRIEKAGGAWELDERLVARLDTDIRVVIEWTSADADIDLWVDEPTGERAYYGNQRTALGGKISDDMTDGYGPEEYAIRRAASGGYEVRVDGFSGDRINPNGPGRVMVRLIRNFARQGQSEQLIDAEVGFDRSDEDENNRIVATIEAGPSPSGD